MTALVNTNLATAMKLLDKVRVRIFLVNCRIRERVTMKRCFKWLAYGPHKANNCWHCGKSGHKAEA